MSDLHARESSSPDWDGPVIDLVEEDRVVGFAYADDDSIFVEFHLDDDGQPWVFDLADLQRVLDTVYAMLAPEGAEIGLAGDDPVTLDGHPVDTLATEFDGDAVRRGPEDEGFYAIPVVGRMIRRCGDLDLAIATLEGFGLTGEDGVEQINEAMANLAAAHDGEPWAAQVAGCNVQAEAVLERWARGPEMAIAVEVMDSSGDRFVL